MSFKDKKIIVTGGAGFIGSHIVDALVKKGAKVIVVDNLSTGNINNISHHKNKVQHHKVSVTDIEALKKIFKGAYAVIHQAGIASVFQSISDPSHSHDINALGTLHVFMAAHEAGVDRVTYASSAAVYGDNSQFPKIETMRPDPLSPYAAQKLMGELYGMIFYNIYGLKTIGLRYFNVFGPRQNSHSDYAGVINKFVGMIKKGEHPNIYGDGKQTRDYIYVDDIVDANLLAIETNSGFGDVYNIASGKSISLNSLVDEINKILGSSIKPKYKAAKKGDIRHSYANVNKAKKVLGFKIKTDFKKGLKKVIDYL